MPSATRHSEVMAQLDLSTKVPWRTLQAGLSLTEPVVSAVRRPSLARDLMSALRG